MEESTKEALQRIALNISRASSGSLDSDEALDQLYSDLNQMVQEMTSPRASVPAKKGATLDDKN